MNRRTACLLIAATPAAAAAFPGDSAVEERPWLGPEYWANPLQDWRFHNGRIECFVSGGDRNVFLLTAELSGRREPFSIGGWLGRLEDDRAPLSEGFAGFRLGVRGRENDYRDSAVYGTGMNAGLTTDGRLFIGKLDASAPRITQPLQNLRLQFDAAPAGSGHRARLIVTSEDGKKLAELTREVPADWLTGGIALVASAGAVRDTPNDTDVRVTMSGIVKPGSERTGTVRFWFRDWSVRGAKVDVHEDRAFGPILWTMYTLSRGVLKLTAQMAPLGAAREPVRLEMREGSRWRLLRSERIDTASATATFRVPSWKDAADVPYRVVFSFAGKQHSFAGVVRRDPVDKPKITLAALSCTNDFGFPHADVVRALRTFRPDLIAFLGDQIYERVGGYGIQRLPLETARLDYLRKWFLFGWAYRDLMRDTPSLSMPDDHDVFHGNVWGAGGRHAEGTGDAGQDSGGYLEPAAWVNTVQRTQTSHLPDPVDPAPVEQGIGVYFTDLRWGGVSFAIIEDRKWKSAPKVVIPKAQIVNGWAQNPAYNAARDGDVPGAHLLGPRQLRFLDRWAQEWTGGVWMKVMLSQTLFANLATLPKPANTDAVVPKLPVLKPGEYPPDDILTADHDSNGWPQSGRDAALRAIRRCQAIHVCGDQHLGSTVHYGVEEWNDAAWALCTPAVSNIFPRRWFPPHAGRHPDPENPRSTGEYLDGFGNRMTVHAFYNPAHTGAEPHQLLDRSPGYGIIEFDRATHRVTFAVWPRGVDPASPGAKPASGWPITIAQTDNGFSGWKWRLDPIARAGQRTGEKDLCVQVIREDTSEVVYTLRMAGESFVPRVPAEGLYTVRLFDPDSDPAGGFHETRKNQRAIPAG